MVAWPLLSHFHRPTPPPGQGWVEVAELSVWELGFPRTECQRGGRAARGLPPTGACSASHCSPWEEDDWGHSRRAFQLPLSNAWLWYSSWSS